MDRRDFLRQAGLVSASLALSNTSDLSVRSAAPPGWRTFEVTTRVEVLRQAGRTRLWLPTPLPIETPYQKPLGNTLNSEGGATSTANDPESANAIACFDFPDGVKPVAVLTCRAMTRDHAVDLVQPQPHKSLARPESKEAIERFLKPTALVPTDGIVRETSRKITRSAREEIDKARAIYEWVVENTYRDPGVRGCGRGDIRAMLESKTFGGKCADLNALYVGLSRAAGLPARHVYGLRVAKSDRGFTSLGLATANATKGQHCRAEVYLTRYGWVPVDPADVRKVILEEPPGNLTLESAAVRKARETLFGSWEMNWIGLNFAHDVALPGSARGIKVGYFMYPQCETADGRIDPFDADNFKYEITSREIVS
jgi:transglutaminase-like putative cysteine protease